MAAIERICASPAFQGRKRSRQFLEHVCRHTLDGDPGALKERSLAIDVFGRAASSDMSDDPIVRVGAREVRKRYASPEARNAAAVIDLPAGFYFSEFRAPSAVAPSAPTPFEQFWAPVFAANDPLLVGISHPIVYPVSARAHQLTDERLGPQTTPAQRPIDVASKQLDATDIIPVRNGQSMPTVFPSPTSARPARCSSATPNGAPAPKTMAPQTGRVLSDPAQLNAVIEKPPPNWESRNPRLLLREKLMPPTPTGCRPRPARCPLRSCKCC